MSCGITGGLINTCDDLRRVGGINKRAWIFNTSDKSSYTFDGDGYVSAITFNTYGGLYEFKSKKQAHSGGYTSVSQEPGGNKFFQHDVILKLFSSDPTDDAVLEELLVANVTVILETNNQEFKIYGGYAGLEESAGVQNSGQADASDIADSITLTGGETRMPLRVFDTDYATTKALLESYVI